MTLKPEFQWWLSTLIEDQDGGELKIAAPAEGNTLTNVGWIVTAVGGRGACWRLQPQVAGKTRIGLS